MKTIFVKQAFDWRISHDFLIAYSPGHNVDVSEECAAHAVARGYAEIADFAEDALFDRSQEIAEDEQVRAIVQLQHDNAVEDGEESR